MGVQDIIEGLNIYRAVEACGERVLRQWAETAPEEEVREGFSIIAQREANHARALAERIEALGEQPGPSCVDDALARFIAQAELTTETQARFDLFDALLRGSGETAKVLATCTQGIRTAFEQGDPDTRAMLQEIFVDEKLSMDWCAAHSPNLTTASTGSGLSETS
ncbi:MAG: ferritin-like domain-containing protein [Dehalococcoidia bacterium]|nr:ferritin-like domain-containing protein [Dehalococcoidia bacterium]